MLLYVNELYVKCLYVMRQVRNPIVTYQLLLCKIIHVHKFLFSSRVLHKLLSSNFTLFPPNFTPPYSFEQQSRANGRKSRTKSALAKKKKQFLFHISSFCKIYIIYK